jgi:hypothetical protein
MSDSTAMHGAAAFGRFALSVAAAAAVRSERAKTVHLAEGQH